MQASRTDPKPTYVYIAWHYTHDTYVQVTIVCRRDSWTCSLRPSTNKYTGLRNVMAKTRLFSRYFLICCVY
jgi:hypothetical protein